MADMQPWFETSYIRNCNLNIQFIAEAVVKAEEIDQLLHIPCKQNRISIAVL
jgi:hypothetical protein